MNILCLSGTGSSGGTITMQGRMRREGEIKGQTVRKAIMRKKEKTIKYLTCFKAPLSLPKERS